MSDSVATFTTARGSTLAPIGQFFFEDGLRRISIGRLSEWCTGQRSLLHSVTPMTDSEPSSIWLAISVFKCRPSIPTVGGRLFKFDKKGVQTMWSPIRNRRESKEGQLTWLIDLRGMTHGWLRFEMTGTTNWTRSRGRRAENPMQHRSFAHWYNATARSSEMSNEAAM